MPINQVIADLADALSATREELATVNMAIDDVQAKLQGVQIAPPHADDIASAFIRGLDGATREFERQLARHLNPTNARAGEAAEAAARGAAQLLTLQDHGPDERRLLPASSLNGVVGGLNPAAVTYFLRDRIAAEVPALVGKLCPGSERGMKAADRAQMCRELETQLATLTARRDELQADLGAARAAVLPPAR